MKASSFILLAGLVLAGCGKSPVGVYVNPDDSHDRLEVRSDGSYTVQTTSWGEKITGGGTWQVQNDGKTVVAAGSNGRSGAVKMNGNRLINYRTGETWVKQGEVERVEVDFPSRAEIDAYSKKDESSNGKAWSIK